MKNSIIIVGGFHEIIELAEENNENIHGLIDNSRVGNYMNYSILGTDDDIDKVYNQFGDIPILITPDNPSIRKKLYKKYIEKGFSFISLISKKSKISLSSKIGQGTIIQSGVNISCESIIEKFVKLNTNSNITHNVTIGDFTTIAPNAVILGNVEIGKSCYIGANSTILPNVVICDETVIGAGAVVTKSILEKGTYIGVPAKLLVKD